MACPGTSRRSPEVIADRAGDCQAQAVLTASILEAKGMPYTLRYSFDHVWVDYPGKEVTALEDPATSFVSDDGEGWLAESARQDSRCGRSSRCGSPTTGRPCRFAQKLLILLGATVIVGYGERRFFLQRLRRRGVARPTRAWSLQSGVASSQSSDGLSVRGHVRRCPARGRMSGT